jgi:hypothetical protein
MALSLSREGPRSTLPIAALAAFAAACGPKINHYRATKDYAGGEEADDAMTASFFLLER